MSLGAFALIVFSAMLHATWNFYAKTATANKVSTLWFGWVVAGFISLPFAIYFTDFSQFTYHWVPYIVITGIVHAFYLYLLGWSYSIGEMSLIYPIARGLAIVLTVLIVIATGMDHVSKTGMIGIIMLAGGIVLVAIKRIRDFEKRLVMIAACMVGVCVSAYSIVDKLSLKYIPPLFYISIMFVTTSVILAPMMISKLRDQSLQVIKEHKAYSSMIGVFSFVTYLLILLALKSEPAPYVVALREISIVFGSILGIKILHEERNKRKMIGIFMILIGALVIKLA